MKQLKKGRVAAGAAAALLLGCLSTSVQAEAVTEKLFESTVLVTASTSMNLTDLNLSSPGKLTISLNDLAWPALLDTLSFSLTDATHVLQTFAATGPTNTWTFNVSAPGTYYGTIFAKPSAAARAGMYHATYSYESVAPVPLPAAAWLLFSGIAGLAAFKPKQKLSPVQV